MRVKKIISSMLMLMLMLTLTLSNATIAKAEELTTKIKLNDIFVTVPYASSSIDIKYATTATEVEATIIDKATGNILDVFGEVIEKEEDKEKESLLPMISTLADGSTFRRLVYRDKTVGPATSRLYCNLEIYTYGLSFRQINKVISTYWSEVSSGNWKLEREVCDAYMDATPDTKVNVEGTANIVIETTSETTGSFSISALESFGYEVSHAVGSTYYARTPISFQYTYSVY